jgi:hypothetical protein
MKRLHVHLSVEDIARSVRFHSTLFAAEPAFIKPDYRNGCSTIRVSRGTSAK